MEVFKQTLKEFLEDLKEDWDQNLMTSSRLDERIHEFYLITLDVPCRKQPSDARTYLLSLPDGIGHLNIVHLIEHLECV